MERDRKNRQIRKDQGWGSERNRKERRSREIQGTERE